MMGRKARIFRPIESLTLDALVPVDHCYRHVERSLNLSFVRDLVAGRYAVGGRPSIDPVVFFKLQLVMFFEGIRSERQLMGLAADRLSVRWYLGYDLHEPLPDHSSLTHIRDRYGLEIVRRFFETIVELCQQAGLIWGQELYIDATQVKANASLDSLAPPAWFERYRRRLDDDDVPDGQAARQAHAETIGRDGLCLLELIYAPDAPSWLRESPAVETLPRMWVHQFVVINEVVHLRDADNLPSASLRMDSPDDPDARRGSKPGTSWSGDKVHITETCDPDAPHVMTNVETTQATVADVRVTGPIHTALAIKDLLPSRHFVDAGYISASDLVSSRTEHGIELIAPMRVDGTWQARAGNRYDITSFSINWDAKTVRCPHGHRSAVWRPLKDQHGKPTIHIEFKKEVCAVCGPCPVHARQAERAPTHPAFAGRAPRSSGSPATASLTCVPDGIRHPRGC